MGGGGVQQSPGERAQADLAQEQWNDYKTSFQPIDKQIIARAKNKDRGRTLGINMAAGGAGQAYDQADKAIASNMSQRGINPNSGRFMSVVNGMKRDRGNAVIRAGVGANMSADIRYASKMNNAIAHGRGVQGVAIEGITQFAQRSNRQASADARFKTANRGAYMSAAGSLVGIGAKGYMAANVAGSNGQNSGWATFKNARSNGATMGEAAGLGWDQTQMNNRSY